MFALVHYSAPSSRLVYSSLREFTRSHPFVFAWVHSGGLVSSIGQAYGSSGSFGLAWDNYGVDRCRRVHSGSLGFTRAALIIVAFILLCLG